MWKVASPQHSLPALYLLAVDIGIAGFGDVGRPLTASRTCEAVTRHTYSNVTLHSHD